MNHSRLLIGLSLLTLAATSCKEDYFDQEAYTNIVKQAFPVENVDPTHDWATIGSATVRIGINLTPGETYSVRIYDQNPISKKSGLSLLGKGTVQNGQALVTTISYPLDQNYVFVALFDSEHYMTVYPATIEDGKIEMLIGGSKAAGARRKARNVQSHDFNFPEPPDASLFATQVPGDARNEDQYYERQSGNFFVSTSDSQINVWNGNANLYFAQGTYNITSLGLNNNTTFYLLPGANVTMPGAIKYGNVNFYIARGATLNIIDEINANVHFFNQGTINARSITLYSSYNPWWNDPNASDGTLYNQGSVNVSNSYHTDDHCQTVNDSIIIAGSTTVDEDAQLLNRGTLTISGHLGVENDRSLFINEGTVTAASVGVAGSADFYNDGTAIISGETLVNSNQCTWHNDGTYTTQRYTYHAGSTDVINNCRLIVTDLFYLGLGDTDRNRFQLNGAGSVVTQDFEFSGPGFIDMGAGSLFQVKGTAYMAITKDVYGIYGPAEGDYAVFQAKQIVRRSNVDPNQGFVANYFGHLYVATDHHFNFGYSDKSAAQQAAGEVGAQPYYRLDAASGATMTSYDGANVHPSDVACGAAYNGEPEAQEPAASSFSLRYCFEDNFPEPGDYDMNDVVITLTPTIDGKNVTLVASLDAVGAMEQVAAAIRIVGLQNSDIVNLTWQGDLDANYPATAVKIIKTTEPILPDNMKYHTTDVVLNFFSYAHWAMNPEYDTNGSVLTYFYNTVERGNPYHAYMNDVTPKTVTYNFELATEEAAAKFCESCLDVFIIEGYNGGYWEVHTFPWKTVEVLNDYASGNKSMYSDNMPWAICVPGNNFKYPIEWNPIATHPLMPEKTGAYEEPGHSFREWAQDHTKATDWYKHPDSKLVYE